MSEVTGTMLGKAGELRVASELLLRNYEVALVMVDNGIDLILSDGRRIQVKTSHLRFIKTPYNHTVYAFNFLWPKSWKRRVKFGDNNHVLPHPLPNVDFVTECHRLR